MLSFSQSLRHRSCAASIFWCSQIQQGLYTRACLSFWTFCSRRARPQKLCTDKSASNFGRDWLSTYRARQARSRNRVSNSGSSRDTFQRRKEQDRVVSQTRHTGLSTRSILINRIQQPITCKLLFLLAPSHKSQERAEFSKIKRIKTSSQPSSNSSHGW